MIALAIVAIIGAFLSVSQEKKPVPVLRPSVSTR